MDEVACDGIVKHGDVPCGGTATHTCDDAEGHGSWYFCDDHADLCCEAGVDQEESP